MSLCDAKSPKNQEIPTSYDRNTERGSAIVIILIMIALLAALTYTFSSGSRTGGATLSREKVDLHTTEILDYAQSIKQAVQTLQINGCSDTEISFEANALSAGYANTNSPADNSCHVFHPNGGGLQYVPADDDVTNDSEYYFLSNLRVLGMGTDFPQNSSSTKELGLVLTQLNEDVCRKINEKLNIPEVGGTVPEDSGDFVDAVFPYYFNGIYPSGGGSIFNSIVGTANDCVGGNGPTREYCGRPSGCFKEQTGNEYFIFYQVLIPR